MPRDLDIRSDLLVPRERRAAHRCIPTGTPVSRCQYKRPARPRPQTLQRIQKFSIVPVLPAAKAPAPAL